MGLLIGAAIGYVAARGARAAARRALVGVQAPFLDATFAVMGALCKADGVVTRNEIKVTQQLFGQLGLTPEQRQAAKAAFNRGKAAEFDLDAEVDGFAQASGKHGVLRQLFLQVQLTAVAADGQVHPAEHAMLVRVARRLGLAEADLARLEALLRAAAGGATPSGLPPRQRIDDAYTALGLTAEASDGEIKKAYRKLMRDNHPDRLAAKGLPDGMRAIAERRAREINVAYDLLKKARGLA